MNWKKAYNKFESVFIHLWFVGMALLLTGFGMALVGKFVSIEGIFNDSQVFGIIVLLVVVSMWLPFYTKVTSEIKKKTQSNGVH